MPDHVSIKGIWYDKTQCVRVGGKWVLKSSLKPKPEPKVEVEENLDITGDGVVDDKDRSLAARVLRTVKKKTTKKKK